MHGKSDLKRKIFRGNTLNGQLLSEIKMKLLYSI